MTISSTTTKNSYSGNGSTTAFTYGFYIPASTDIQVIVRSSTGTETVKSEGTGSTNYSISGVGSSSGGTVTFVTSPASGETVVLRRATAQTQTTDYVANDPFPAETHEDALDKLTIINQDLQEQVDRSLKLSRTNTMTSTEFTVGSSDRANKILAFDSDGELSVTQELGTFRGNWATSTAYVLRDIVVQNSASDSSTYKSVYICKTANTSTGSYLTQSDSSKWDKLVDLAAYDTLSELSDTTIGSLSSGHMLLYDGSDSWDNKAMSGDATISSTGALTIASGAVETGMIAADAITGAKIADDAINSEHYTDGSIDTAHIADSQVTTAKIAGDAITGAKIADDAVDSEHYTDGSIDNAHIADDAIDSEHYADGSIDTAHIADSQVTTAKIAADAITSAKIADDAIDSEHYTDGSIDNAHIADDAIDSEHYADGSIDTAHIADSQVTTAKIAADAITGAKIADDAIDSEHYTDGSIDNAHIADDAIDSEHYADGSIDTAHIADSQVTTAKIAADAIDATKIADDAISEEHLDNTAITGLSAKTSVAGNDLVIISDSADSDNLKKMTRTNFVAGLSAGSAGSVADSDSDTKIQAEESSDEDILRFDTAGTERATMDIHGLELQAAGGIFSHAAAITNNFTLASTHNAVLCGPTTFSGTATIAGNVVVV